MPSSVDRKYKRRSDVLRSALLPVHPFVFAHNELAGSGNCLPFSGTTGVKFSKGNELLYIPRNIDIIPR